jgi:hypothetical protein
MVRLTGVRIHVATMSRALAQIKARRGRPRPTLGCPWSKAAKTRRLNRIQQVLATLPPPGKNQKRYLASALEMRTRVLI